MKGTFGYLLLIFTALMLLTVIGGINSLFTSISATWTSDQTGEIADALSQVFWYGGVVFVSVIGYMLFIQMNKGGGGSRRPAQPSESYMLTGGDIAPATPRLLTDGAADGDWYELEPPQKQLVR